MKTEPFLLMPSEIWELTVQDWQKANGFLPDLKPPDINAPYHALTGLEKACLDRFNRRCGEYYIWALFNFKKPGFCHKKPGF